ncbi:MAG TPA: hypothetical protein VLT87_02575, partial [Thermoanaerobaculia bacterium]|nr:hypothetical protein [Thermoanaerobaculia bacterium]
MSNLLDRLARLTPEQRVLLERRLKSQPPRSEGPAESRGAKSGGTASIPLLLPAAVAEDLRELARRRQAPFAAVLLAAFAVLLRRAAGRFPEVIDLY